MSFYREEEEGELNKKTFREIRSERGRESGEKWFFIGWILTFPETMVAQQEIRQAIFVFEEEQPEQVLVVVLSEPAVRKYCNILKPFSKIQIINGVVKASYLNNNYVLVTEQSHIRLLEGQMPSKKGQSKLISAGMLPRAASTREELANQESTRAVSLNLPNVNDNIVLSSTSSEESEESHRNTKSQKIQTKRENPKEELVSFCGTVITSYQIGRGKSNHGVGYRIQERFSNCKYEIVIWSEMNCNLLRKGETYEFKNFRIHKKHNLEISYHSHVQYSTITPSI